jgi:hypothetical protein
LAGGGIEIPGEGDERQIDGVHHHFNAHQNDNNVLPNQYSSGPNSK